MEEAPTKRARPWRAQVIAAEAMLERVELGSTFSEASLARAREILRDAAELGTAD